jgi:hypothetical protein
MFMHTNSVNCCEKPYISLHEMNHFITKKLILLCKTLASVSGYTWDDASNLLTKDYAHDQNC